MTTKTPGRVMFDTLEDMGIDAESAAEEVGALEDALSAAGFVIVPREPTSGQVLLLGLISGAGPQSRETYVEAWRAMIAEAEKETTK